MGRNLLILIIMGLAAPAAVQAEQRLSLDLSNWTAGVEYESPWGVFVDLHSPWALGALNSMTSGVDWTVPLGARLGYAFRLGDSWSIRTGLRLDLIWWYGNPCMGADEQNLRSILLAELGLRWQHTSGLRLGVDLVPLGFEKFEGCDDEAFSWWREASFMSQVTVGWSWTL